MALFRCSKCGHLREVTNDYVGNVDKAQFFLCVVGLSQEQIQGLTSMYDLTFVNENNFLEHVGRLLQQKGKEIKIEGREEAPPKLRKNQGATH